MITDLSTMIGQTLGHFQLVEKLGEGGMGVVYKARDIHLDRLVAIKVLPADKVGDSDRRRRFVQEAKAASALNHPGIVTIHEVAEHEGTDFIAMELLPGRTLDRVIPRHGLRLPEALHYGMQISDALSAAHAAGIVHRDLKPANVMVSDQGHVKLLDFGLAKLVDRVGLQAVDDIPTATRPVPLTDHGAIVGTVAYMAPEQAEGRTVDARADIFSFGAVLYEMVTGQRPFRGDSTLSILTAILREEPKPVSQINAGLPLELDRVIGRCLRKDPERRWQAIADIKVALHELKDESASSGLTLPAAATAPRRARAVLVIAFASVIVAGAIGAVLWSNRPSEPPNPVGSLHAIPLTTYQGREQQPAFSPDGNAVAFSGNGEAEDNWDVYVKQIGPGSPLRVTTDPAPDVSPAWSRDGRSIAFVRVHRDRQSLVVIPSLGGPEREVFEFNKSVGLGAGQLLSWSADSRFVVVGGSTTREGRDVLTAVELATGATSQITKPSAGTRGDSLPAVSPDGNALAFVRHSGVLTGELYVQAVSAGLAPIAEPRRLGKEGLIYHGVTWSADGRGLIVSTGNVSDLALWRISLRDGDEPERISPSGGEWRQPTVALQQSRLAFTRSSWDENIWRVALSAPGRTAGPPTGMASSTQLDLNAQFSPDGARIVFESLRSGTQEVWVADRDGRNAMQLTFFNGQRGGTPAWSPDGLRIAFDLRSDTGRGDIFIVPARGGAPVRVTSDPADDLVPSWSRDGRSIYFGSTRSGRYEIWKVSPQGGEAVQVTQKGGTYAKESVDGKQIYYARTDTLPPTLWRAPVSGGEEVQVLPGMAAYGNFAVARDGIYFEASQPDDDLGHFPMFTAFSRPGTAIDFLSFSTGKISRVLTLARHAGHGLDASADGRTLLFGQMDSLTEDLMLVENFR